MNRETYLLLLSILFLSHAEKVIVTITPGAVQWTCFDMDSKTSCCQSITGIHASVAVADITSPDLSYCVSQLAIVPPTLAETLQIPKSNVAQFSLILDTKELLSEPGRSIHSLQRQYSWENHQNNTNETLLVELDSISSPFIYQSSEQSERISIHSQLSTSGGMHRLFHHQIQLLDPGETCYLFLTITNATFVDLDDAFEDGTFIHKESFIHSAGICDIEQPAFESGQHVLVREFSTTGTKHDSNNLQFATKLHLRYPYPSPTYQQTKIFLPDPQLLCQAPKNGSLRQQLLAATQNRPSLDYITIAAGSDDDYDLVMWTTILMCLVGVLWMMIDISSVAKWDP